MLKLFFRFRWINQSLAIKILGILCIVCLILIPAGSWLSYQRAYSNAQQSAELKIHELVDVIHKHAAIAAYLNDEHVAREVMDGLSTVPEVYGVAFTLSSGKKLTKGLDLNSTPQIHVLLSTSFDTIPVGSLSIFINSEYINQQAKSKGLEVVLSELVFIFTIIIFLFISYRILIYHPLQSLVKQLKDIQLSDVCSRKKVSIPSSDEIGFLAENMNAMIGKIHDSYARDRENNLRIYELEKQFRMIFDNSFSGIALLNSENKVSLANAAFSAIFSDKYQGISDGQRHIAQAFSDDKQVEHVLSLVRKDQQNIFRDFELKGADDIWLRALFSFIEIDVEGGSEHSEQYVEIVVYDISDRARKEKHFAYNAAHDSLTGLLNRRGAEPRFSTQMDNAQSRYDEFGLILIDLNNFKPVNDGYGHEAGDIVLKEISSRLLSVVSTSDVVARWGGDEFIISTVLKSKDNLEGMLNDIQQVFDEEIDVGSDINVKVGASIGVSTSALCGYDIPALIEHADRLMYQAKKERKDEYRFSGRSG